MLLQILALAHVHLYVEPWAAMEFASQMRSHMVSRNVVPLAQVAMRARALCAIDDALCTGAVLQTTGRGYDESTLYVLRRNAYDDGVHIACVLWHPHKRMTHDMKALRTWYDDRFPDSLHGDALEDARERDAWERTSD